MKLLFHGMGLYAAGKKFGPASWPHQDLLFVKEGSALLQTPKGIVHLRSGDGVWIPDRLRFEGLAEEGKVTIWVLHFAGSKLKVGTLTSQREAGLSVFRQGGCSNLAGILMERLHEIYQGDSRWPAHADGYMLALLAEMSRNSQQNPDGDEKWIRDLERWAREHLTEGIKVRDLAAHVGLSHSHFCKIFRQRRKISAGRFLQGLRLDEARSLLHQTALGLKEIAARVGYSDAVALHHAFCTRFRMSPLTFRRAITSAV